MPDEKQRLTVHMLRRLLGKHVDEEGRIIYPEGMKRTMQIKFQIESVGKPQMETIRPTPLVETTYIKSIEWSEIEGLTAVVAGESVYIRSTPFDGKNPILDLWNEGKE